MFVAGKIGKIFFLKVEPLDSSALRIVAVGAMDRSLFTFPIQSNHNISHYFRTRNIRDLCLNHYQVRLIFLRQGSRICNTHETCKSRTFENFKSRKKCIIIILSVTPCRFKGAVSSNVRLALGSIPEMNPTATKTLHTIGIVKK